MNSDRNLELLNKVVKLIRAHEMFSSARNLTDYEEQVLERLEVGMEILEEITDAMDDLWEVHTLADSLYSEMKVLDETIEKQTAELKPAPKSVSKPAKTDEDTLALGIGLAVGGVFDYLKAPENVEKVEEQQMLARSIETISDEELEMLEADIIDDFGGML
jgi:hypothetical protein